jgi:hypothetical protein
MSGVQPKEHPDPLKECTRYVKIADLSSGSFGFVQLARNTETNELVAIKFIERGDRCGRGQGGLMRGVGAFGLAAAAAGERQRRRRLALRSVSPPHPQPTQPTPPTDPPNRPPAPGQPRVNRYVEAEILNHRSLRHPHVIEFKEVFVTSEYICIAMEFASGGSLFTYVQRAVRLKEAAARWFFQQLIIGCAGRFFGGGVWVSGWLSGSVGLSVGLSVSCGVGVARCRHTREKELIPSCSHSSVKQAGLLPPQGRGEQRHQARKHAAADGRRPPPAAAQDLRLWVLQGAPHERAQVQGGDAGLHGAGDHQGDG